MAALAGVKVDQTFWKDYLSAQEATLPHLDDIEYVTDRVVRILAGNPGEMQLQGTNTYLVGTGKSRILVDTGEGIPIWADSIIKVLKEHDLDISHILLTHWHGDHTGGVPDLIAYDPELASRVYKNHPDRGQKNIVDGQLFSTEGATVKAIFSPGHSIDHMCFVLEEEKAMFTGDNVLGHGYTVVEDLGLYMNSLDHMDAQGCQIGYPAHGVRIENLPRKIKQYISHRTSRERLICGALEKRAEADKAAGMRGRSSMTCRELVTLFYGEVPDQAFEGALEPFTSQVLCKLAEERKVGFGMDNGTKRWFLQQPQTRRSRLSPLDSPLGSPAASPRMRSPAARLLMERKVPRVQSVEVLQHL